MKYPLDTQNLKGIFMYILILRAVIKYAYLSFVNKKGEPIIALLFLCCLICNLYLSIILCILGLYK